MEPEISHRCPACGVALRSTATFCPQCGRPVKAGGVNVGGKTEAADSSARRKSEAGLNTSIITPRSNAAEAPPGQESARPRTVSNTGATAGITTPLKRDVEERARQSRVAGFGGGEAEGKSTPRVEKLRHASSAMLEEASADPGLRFILVAIVLFVLSLLLLLLNHLLG